MSLIRHISRMVHGTSGSKVDRKRRAPQREARVDLLEPNAHIRNVRLFCSRNLSRKAKRPKRTEDKRLYSKNVRVTTRLLRRDSHLLSLPDIVGGWRYLYLAFEAFSTSFDRLSYWRLERFNLGLTERG